MRSLRDYNARVCEKYNFKKKEKTRVQADSQFDVEIWSINNLVEESSSVDDAMDRFKGMHGFSMSEDMAHKVLNQALERKFGNQ